MVERLLINTGCNGGGGGDRTDNLWVTRYDHYHVATRWGLIMIIIGCYGGINIYDLWGIMINMGCNGGMTMIYGVSWWIWGVMV